MFKNILSEIQYKVIDLKKVSINWNVLNGLIDIFFQSKF